MQIEEIKQAVCTEFGITPAEMETKSRKHRVAIPRHIFYRLVSTNYSKMPLNEIAGTLQPKKHHSTIISSLRTAGDLIYTGHVRNNYYRILKNLGYTDAEALKEIKRPTEDRRDVRELGNVL